MAFISSVVILCICMYLFFPFPNNPLFGASYVFMSFPLQNSEGINLLGILGSILFIIAIALLINSLKKYYILSIVFVILFYAFLPRILITVYQETLASGIAVISYDGNGKCEFESESENIVDGKCQVVLQNRSNEAVLFEVEFLDSYYEKDQTRMESLMNIAGPYKITIAANQEETISLNELLDVSNVSNHMAGGASRDIHIKLIDGENERVL